MTAESILGLVDHLKQKSPDASETHIAAKIGFSDYGKSDWLEKIDNSCYWLRKELQEVESRRLQRSLRRNSKTCEKVVSRRS